MCESDKSRFIKIEIWILSWGASVQRAKLYKPNLPSSRDKDKATFRKKLTSYIEGDILPKYVKRCSESQHLKNIQKIIDKGNELGKGLLARKGYKYGIAQKLLNMVLKYWWCLGYISRPPHCPIDRIVLSKTKFRNKVNWTEIVAVEEYKKIITEIRSIAKKTNRSPAQWELDEFGRV